MSEQYQPVPRPWWVQKALSDFEGRFPDLQSDQDFVGRMAALEALFLASPDLDADTDGGADATD